MKNNIYFQLGYAYTWITLIVTVILVFLKLDGGLSWSWWWVTVPVWGSLVAAFALLSVCYLIVIIWGKDINYEED